MQASSERHAKGFTGTWPTSRTEGVPGAATGMNAAVTIMAAAPVLPAPHATPDASAAVRDFEACCRALSHKANTALLAQLPQLQQGEVVDLSRNYVGAVGLQAIALVLPSNSNLTELWAPRNGLTNDAVVIFCRAMRGHTRLAVLDFSANTDVSLAAGLALLSLAQQMPSLRQVRLEGTHVPQAVLVKLDRALAMNAARVHTSATNRLGNGQAALTSPGKVLLSSRPPTASKSPGVTDGATEAALLSALEARVRHAVEDGYQLPPDVPSTGWRVLEVPILAPPFLFDTEIELLCTDIFPRLNDEFAPHRLLLCPVVVGGDSAQTRESVVEAKPTCPPVRAGRVPPPPRTIGSYNKELHFAPVCDVVSAVRRGRFAAIELVGDRPGDYTQVPAAAMFDLQKHVASGSESNWSAQEAQPQDEADEAAAENLRALRPVLYEAHEVALRSTQWLFVATRRETRSLRVPAALAPLLTADPSIAHPDRHRTVVRDIVYDDALATSDAGAARKGAVEVAPRSRSTATAGDAAAADAAAGAASVNVQTVNVDIARTLEWDYAAEEYQWKRHLAWRCHVVSTAPVQELVLPQYSATFDCTDAHGAVRLKGLERFGDAIYNRLRTVVQACLSAGSRADKRGSGASGQRDRAGTTSADVDGLFRRIGTQKMWTELFAQGIAAFSSSATKKNVMNRIILYAANPPSRNALVVHSQDVTGLAMLMARATSRLQGLQHAYTLAMYTVRSTVLLEEPDDVRSFVVHVVSQLTTDAAVLRYVYAEVDTERLCAFLLQLLSGTVKTASKSSSARAASAGSDVLTSAAAVITSAGLPEYVAHYTLGCTTNTGAVTAHGSTDEATVTTTAASRSTANAESAHAFVVMIDGIDKLTQPVRPCGALVQASSGGGGGAGGTSSGMAGNRAEPASWSDTNAHNATSPPAATSALISSRGTANASNPLEALLPRALARNVRLIASCVSDSRALATLRHRGRDSVETLSLGPVSANEVEQYLAPTILSRLGLTFSEDDFECARGKQDAATGEYMRYLQDAARASQEAPGFLTQSQVIQAFPDTTAEAAQGVYDRLVCAFGLPLTRNVLGFLTASRWGLTMPELRALFPQLSACRLQELLRLLRPVLEPELPVEASAEMGFASGNTQLGNVHVLVRSFLDVAHREALHVVTDEQQIDNDQRVWHSQLAQYYLSIVYKCLGTHKTSGVSKQSGLGVSNATPTGAASGASPRAAIPLAEQRRAMKEVIYHMTQSGTFWPQLDVTVLSLPFLSHAYELGLGYALLRDLTAAFNERYQRHLLGEDIGEASWQSVRPEGEGTAASASAVATTSSANTESSRYALPAVLSRMRDYVRFAHDQGLLLSLRPSLVAQVALQIPANALNSVQRDAVTFLYRQLLVPPQRTIKGSVGQQHQSSFHYPHHLYFATCTSAAASGKSAATHLGPVTCAAFLPNRKFIITASRDRSLAWVNPQTGTVIWHARQPTAPIESLVMCHTSAYVAAVSQDRTVWIYDGLQGKLVTQCRGNEWFDAPIDSVVFSARGRYVWVITTDTRARCFECETGLLRCTLGVDELLGPVRRDLCAEDGIDAEGDSNTDNAEAGAQQQTVDWRHRRHYLFVVPDQHEDEVCVTVVGHELRQWHLQPWRACSPADVAEVPAVPAKAKDSVVAFELMKRFRVLPSAGTSSLSAKVSAGGSEGYRKVLPWEPTTALVAESRRAVHAFALPQECSAEVHLLALPADARSGQTVTPAVRCVFGTPQDGDEEAVSVLRASPDGAWLAVGMTSGKVGLFHVGAAYRSWLQQGLFSALSVTSASSATDGAVVCEPVRVFTGLMPVPGTAFAPIRDVAFHRDGRLLFAVGRSLKCWCVPAGAAAEETSAQEVGEYVWAQVPTCFTVLPPAVAPSSDVELPSGVAELCVGDETGRLTLLKLWKPSY